MTKPEISIVIPAYNEEVAIGKVLDEVENVMRAHGNLFEILVIDDGSTDRTADVVASKKYVRMIRHQTNMGYGAAIKTGIKNARGEIILMIDSDGTYPAKDIMKILNETKEADMVVGARTGENVNIPILRRIPKYLLSKFANYLAETEIPDLNSGMRAFRRSDAMKFFNLYPNKFSFTTTITLAYHSNGYLVKYVPIDYYKRGGKSKIHPIRDPINFASLIVRTITYFNPLKVFLPVSILLFIFGLIWAAYKLLFFRIFSDISIIVIISSIQIGLFGLLADLIVRGREA